MYQTDQGRTAQRSVREVRDLSVGSLITGGLLGPVCHTPQDIRVALLRCWVTRKGGSERQGEALKA